MQSIEFWEFLLAPVYLLLPVVLGYTIPSSANKRLFAQGLAAKLVGVFGYTFVYYVYYQGGDTQSYFQVTTALNNLLLQNPSYGIEAFFSSYSSEIGSYFNSSTGYPYRYICNATSTYLVSKFASPFALIGLNSYLLTSIILATFFFLPAWDFYKICSRIINGSKTQIAICTLFFPSVLFWGSGISKDSITFASLIILTSSVYLVVIKRQIIIWRILISIVAGGLILFMKPYIFLIFALAGLVWVSTYQVNKIQNVFLRVSILPIVSVLLIIIISALFGSFSSVLGDYSSEKIIAKAIISQEDLKRDFYGGNYFDIGNIEPTTIGLLSKFPIATFWGFFGPTVLNINSAVMLFSAFETTVMLFLTIAILTYKNPLRTFRKIQGSAFLTFCLIFSVAFAFGIGVSTPNFGALVRFKIPLLPLFSLLLLTVYQNFETND